MKKFLVVEEQDGGCDYTIGCGVKVSFIEAEEMRDAAKIYIDNKTRDYITEEDGVRIVEQNPFTTEMSPNRVSIFEVGVATGLDIDKLKASFDDMIKESSAILKEKEERAAFEELKKKFKDRE